MRLLRLLPDWVITLSIDYNANTVAGRSVTINLTPTSADGTTGDVVPLTITQEAGPPTLTVETIPADLNLDEYSRLADRW